MPTNIVNLRDELRNLAKKTAKAVNIITPHKFVGLLYFYYFLFN